MVSVSCFYCHYNHLPVICTFIQFEKFVKVCLNQRIVILTKEQLVSNTLLFQIFKMSLLCTEDVSKVDLIAGDRPRYRIFTQMYWKYLRFTDYYTLVDFEKSHLSTRNPLNAKEPKRSSSEKKVRKFVKLLGSLSDRIKDPNHLLREFLAINDYDFLLNYFEKYINHNKNNPQIIGLSQIYHNYGVDVYRSIAQFM